MDNTFLAKKILALQADQDAFYIGTDPDAPDTNKRFALSFTHPNYAAIVSQMLFASANNRGVAIKYTQIDGHPFIYDFTVSKDENPPFLAPPIDNTTVDELVEQIERQKREMECLQTKLAALLEDQRKKTDRPSSGNYQRSQHQTFRR